MIRWLTVCLLVCASAVAVLFFVIGPNRFTPEAPAQAPPPRAREKGSRPGSIVGRQPMPQLIEFGKGLASGVLEEIVIPGATLVIAAEQEVPTEKEGKIVVIGTLVQPDEVVPPEKQIPDIELGFLAIAVAAGEQLQPGEKPFKLFENSPVMYRRLRDTDQLEPGKIVLARETRKVRKLHVGDTVKRGQLLALINPRKAFDEVAMRVAKIGSAEADRRASQKKKEEYQRRYDVQYEQNRLTPGSVSKEEMRTTLLQRDNFKYEEEVKAAELVKAQRELNAALTDLRMHEIRASIDGTIKVIYKNHEGEAIKANEPVLKIQNAKRLRVEGLLEVQEALKLKEGMKVIVEASRPEHPRRVLGGHLGTVTCVAVSKGKRPIVVSGSEDETLRGWDAATGQKLWLLRGLKSPVRSVACSPVGSKTNLALFGCADGVARLLDLDNLKDKPRDLAQRHEGAINGVAFSPDGEVCATCGDDRSICLWKTETGELLHRLPPVHRNAVTSVQFASANRLVSAGKDNRLVVWDVEPGNPPKKIAPDFDGRGGEVAQIGVTPDGKVVLFDQGKELRLLSLADKQIVGTLQNPAGAMNFSTLALFSPDGHTILTNGAAAGQLQLWRTPAQARASELRKFIWTTGAATCGAFAPQDGSFLATGTQDHQVLIWSMPSDAEVKSRLEARLTLVEKHLDTRSRQVRVWAELNNPDWLIPGGTATMVVPPQQ